MNKKTLAEIFESHKEELSTKLKGLSLPKDGNEVQTIVTSFLNVMFENDGSYRQSLTQSEDYILQCALQLLHAQQDIASEYITTSSIYNTPSNDEANIENKPYMSIVGAGVGAVAGGLLSTWGAVGGAIAGTAISVYLTIKPKKTTTAKGDKEVVRTINVDAFINIIKKICESIDNLMETYRVQVKRIQNSYEQKEKPSLLNECSALFTQIANVNKVVNAYKEETPKKVINATEMLIESLENYGLVIKNDKVVSE